MTEPRIIRRAKAGERAASRRGAAPDDEHVPARGLAAGINSWLLGVIAAVIAVTALEVTAPITLPFVLSLFLIAVFWPLQQRLEARLPRTAAVGVTVVCFLAIAALFVGSLWLSAELVALKAPAYGAQLREVLARVEAWWREQYLLLPGGGFDGQDMSTLMRGMQSLLVEISGGVLSFVIASLLVVTFLVLGMLEVGDFRAKLSRAFGEAASARGSAAVHRLIANLHRYIVLRTTVGLAAGVAAALFSWAIGLELAFIWGLLNFLVKYVPTIGPTLAIFPPALFALLQFQSFEMVLVVIGGIALIQFLSGNYLDPLLQGAYLSVSPLVVFLSLVFWTWLWGAVGALISAPLTIGILIVCDEFERTRWVATLFLRPRAGSRSSEPSLEGSAAR
ncbi:MAG: AI-2E family transporter [Gammaproteobacteria bacterium]|nr:AI-2E family transporter [Gammaproteobacteria bacterium]NIR84762.1 AI-2E family transporter [Gammaproteobacteria bacterium]NIR91258.1 AI-2E family transporter [Gammaproteobacteria bacterium]NIU05805.1 AI-2E family transporter [Gammaproteobacteria bacterium]NIV52924.1 AI-2E family transporter [Gammaproteobacteria bacterium]